MMTLLRAAMIQLAPDLSSKKWVRSANLLRNIQIKSVYLAGERLRH